MQMFLLLAIKNVWMWKRSSKIIWKLPRSRDNHSFKMYCVHLLISLIAHQYCFLKTLKRNSFIQIPQSHFARTGQRQLHPSSEQSLVLQHYRGGCPVPRVAFLSTTAVHIQHTSEICEPVQSLARLFSLIFFFKQSNRGNWRSSSCQGQ